MYILCERNESLFWRQKLLHYGKVYRSKNIRQLGSPQKDLKGSTSQYLSLPAAKPTYPYVNQKNCRKVWQQEDTLIIFFLLDFEVSNCIKNTASTVLVSWYGRYRTCLTPQNVTVLDCFLKWFIYFHHVLILWEHEGYLTWNRMFFSDEIQWTRRGCPYQTWLGLPKKPPGPT